MNNSRYFAGRTTSSRYFRGAVGEEETPLPEPSGGGNFMLLGMRILVPFLLILSGL